MSADDGVDTHTRQARPPPAGALAVLACALAGAALNLAGWREWAPTWPALAALLLLGLALLAARLRRIRLAALLVAPVLLLGSLVVIVVLAGRRADLAQHAAALASLPANSAAGLLAAGLALALGLRSGGISQQVAGTLFAAAAVALGSFGLLGRLLGITPGIGWGAASSVSTLTGAGLVICGATLLLRPPGENSRSVAGGALLPALLVLAIALGATAIAWRFSAESASAALRQRFDHQAEQLAESVRLRLLGYVDVLRGAQGLFAASASVEADEWQRYWDQLDLAARYPGIDGMGYAPRVTAAGRAQFEQSLDAQRPGLRIWPLSEQADYFPITFLQPDTFSNLRQVGFDLGSDVQCREALQRALTRGEPALSGRVELRRNGAAQGEAGFLVFVPLHAGRREEDPPGRVDGVAFFAFRASDWMQPIGREHRSGLHLYLHDGETPDPQRALFADDSDGPVAPEGFSQARPVNVAGRRWTLFVHAAPEFFSSNTSTTPRWVLLIGMLCSLLLFAIAWLLAGARARAERLAVAMTAELRRSQRAFQALTDTATDAIIAAGADGRIRYVNPATGRCFGYDDTALLQQDISVLMPQRYREAHQAGLARFLAGGEAQVIGRTVEMAGLRSSGEEFPLEISIAHWQADGEAHFTAIVRDITRRRDTEQAMESQRRELQRSNADLEQFAYVASHDLQEPLRMVASYVQLLARRYKGKLDQDADDFIGFAVDGAMRMQRLIDDLLTYSRISTRGDTARSVAAGECAAAALRNLDARVRETAAQVEIGELPVVRIDPTQLTQLFQNLIGNALKFCSQAAPLVQLDALREEDSWHFRVRDNGIGLDAQYAERIFVIFQRLHTRQQYTGTGIGLAICKKIVERAGGRIWVESTVGQGATFHFTLPVVEQTA
jgi:PAS domain S-box-containing protein